MSMYNMLMGVTPAVFFILPMLGKHPDEYPRFRDCFLGNEEYPQYDDKIHIYTRVGGGNRPGYQDEIDQLRKTPGYITDFDDSFDCTYATFVFEVPEEFKEDFKKFKEGKAGEFSKKYQERMYEVYPKLKDKLDKLFKKGETNADEGN